MKSLESLSIKSIGSDSELSRSFWSIWYDRSGTYSEAMLISGASKQISSAILYYFRFYNLLKISSSGHHYIPGDEPKNSLRFIITVASPMLLRWFLIIFGFFNSYCCDIYTKFGYNFGKTRCYKNEPVRLNNNRSYLRSNRNLSKDLAWILLENATRLWEC